MHPVKDIHTSRIFRLLGPTSATEHVGLGFTCSCVLEQQTGYTFNSYMLACVLSGEARLFTRGKEFVLKPGTLVQRFAGEPYRLDLDPDTHYLDFFIWLPPSISDFWIKMKFLDTNKTTMPITIDRELVDELKRVIPKLNASTLLEQAEFVRMLEGLVLMLLNRANCHRGTASEDDWLTKAADVLQADVGNRVIIPDLAKDLSVGYESFRKQFRSRYGIPPKEFRIRCRIEAAQKLLLKEGLNATLVAEHLGYPDIYSFSKQFKQITGKSPSAFKKESF